MMLFKLWNVPQLPKDVELFVRERLKECAVRHAGLPVDRAVIFMPQYRRLENSPGLVEIIKCYQDPRLSGQRRWQFVESVMAVLDNAYGEKKPHEYDVVEVHADGKYEFV